MRRNKQRELTESGGDAGEEREERAGSKDVAEESGEKKKWAAVSGGEIEGRGAQKNGRRRASSERVERRRQRKNKKGERNEAPYERIPTTPDKTLDATPDRPSSCTFKLGHD